MSPTITYVGDAERINFDDGGSMDKFPVTLSDGTQGEAWRPANNKYPPKIGDEVYVENGKVKKVPKDGGSKGGGKPNDDPTTDKKITRMHAQKVASEHVGLATAMDDPATWEKFIALCDRLCSDVYNYASNGAAPQTEPTPEPAPPPADPIEVGRAQLAAQAVEENIPASVIGVVLQELTGTAYFTAQALPMIPTIIQKAKAKMDPAAAANDDIPF